MLTEDEKIRYKRQIDISGWDIKTQEKLKNSTVFVAGAGGIGSPVLYYLAAAGVGHIKICDRDKIDLSNLNRQILYATCDVGRSKAEKASEKIIYNNDTIKISCFNTNADWDLLDEIKSCDIIADCFDNFESRHVMNRISIKTGIPMVHAGVSEYYGQITFLHPEETPCLACFIPENPEKENKGIIGAMAGIVGSMQALEIIKYITGTGSLLKNKLLYIDGKSLSTNIIHLKKNIYCKTCSK